MRVFNSCQGTASRAVIDEKVGPTRAGEAEHIFARPTDKFESHAFRRRVPHPNPVLVGACPERGQSWGA